MGDEVDGSGNIVTQTRELNHFSQVAVSNGIVVEIEQGEQWFVEVETDDNIQGEIKTYVENDKLHVESERGFHTEVTPRVRVKMPEISQLETSASGSIRSKGRLISPDLSLNASSGSQIQLEVEADRIVMDASSGSTLEVSGKALEAQTTASSGSQIRAAQLMANSVHSRASSGASTEVYPILSLSGTASSGGNIRYVNQPKNITAIDESSGGSVAPLN